jgi:hypothetical protein
VLNIARGAAFGDIDNDGDVDILTTTNGGAVSLLLNEAAKGSHWIQIRTEQPGGNRFAFGAWVGVERAGKPTIWRRLKTDGSYLCASDARVHIGLGASPSITAIVIQWPDGRRDRIEDVSADRVVTLKRPT